MILCHLNFYSKISLSLVSPGNVKDEQMDDESLADDTLIAGQQNNGYSTEQQLLNQVNQALIKQPTQIPTSMEYASQVLLNQQQPNKVLDIKSKLIVVLFL